MSKGSAPRPFSVSADEYVDSWERIFSKHRANTDGRMAGEYAPETAPREVVSEQVSNPARGAHLWGVAQRAEQVALTH